MGAQSRAVCSLGLVLIAGEVGDSVWIRFYFQFSVLLIPYACTNSSGKDSTLESVHCFCSDVR